MCVFSAKATQLILESRLERRRAAELATAFCAAIAQWRTTHRTKHIDFSVSWAPSVGEQRHGGLYLSFFWESQANSKTNFAMKTGSKNAFQWHPIVWYAGKDLFSTPKHTPISWEQKREKMGSRAGNCNDFPMENNKEKMAQFCSLQLSPECEGVKTWGACTYKFFWTAKLT